MTIATISTEDKEIAKVRWNSADLEVFPDDDTRLNLLGILLDHLFFGSP